MKFSSVLYSSLYLLCSALGPAVAQTNLNFMPLGDSITEFGCWRAYLQGHLQEAGVTGVDWIGSVTDTETCDGVLDWDPDHEGHSGALAIDIANEYLEGWLSAAVPDIVLFHLGTNDISLGHSTEDIIKSFGRMIDLMRESNPAVKILVAQIIPLPEAAAAVNELNAAIPSWAASESTQESPITVVDCNTGFSDSDLEDGVHPNDEGDHKIADAVFPGLMSAIEDSQSRGGGSSTTSTFPTG